MSVPRYWSGFTDIASPGHFTASVVAASDGLSLRTYEWGHGNPQHILLVAPIGVPFLLMSRLASSLGTKFHVVGWEARGAGYLDEDCSVRSVDVARQALDLKEILEYATIEQFHVVAWCTGANVVSWLAARHGITPQTVSFIAPSNIGVSQTETPFNSMFVPLIRSLSEADERKAAFAFKTLRYVAAASQPKTSDEAVVKRLTALNFGSLEAARHYARLLTEFSAASDQCTFFARYFDDLCGRVPSLVIHCMDDDVVSWSAVVDAVDRSKRSRFVVYPSGGHYVTYCSGDQVAYEIMSFLKNSIQA